MPEYNSFKEWERLSKQEQADLVELTTYQLEEDLTATIKTLDALPSAYPQRDELLGLLKQAKALFPEVEEDR